MIQLTIKMTPNTIDDNGSGNKKNDKHLPGIHFNSACLVNKQ